MATECSTSLKKSQQGRSARINADDKSSLNHFGSCSVIAAPLSTVCLYFASLHDVCADI